MFLRKESTVLLLLGQYVPFTTMFPNPRVSVFRCVKSQWPHAVSIMIMDQHYPVILLVSFCCYCHWSIVMWVEGNEDKHHGQNNTSGISYRLVIFSP